MKALEILGKLRDHFSDPKTWIRPGNFTILLKVREITGNSMLDASAYPYLDLACQSRGMPKGDVGGFAYRSDGGFSTHAELMEMLSEATALALNAGET